jgi:predicted naringenin-chalcone synthase
LHHQYGWQRDGLVANALFADGAAAVVVAARGPRAAWRLSASGSTVLPSTTDAMEWRIGDHGFRMRLSPDVPELIRKHLRHWLTRWLADRGLTIEQIGSWAIHPGGPRILEACIDSLDLEPEKLAWSERVLAEFGNMSSPTVLFILRRPMAAEAPRPCLLLAFGPGLTIEAALIE